MSFGDDIIHNPVKAFKDGIDQNVADIKNTSGFLGDIATLGRSISPEYASVSGGSVGGSLEKGVKVVLPIVAAAFVGDYADAAGWGAASVAAASGATAGATSAALNGGSVGEGALKGAATGALTAGITPMSGNTMTSNIVNSAARGGVGGALNAKMSGQDVENGIYAGLLSGAAGGAAGTKASQLSGGDKLITGIAAGTGAGLGGIVAGRTLPNKPPTPQIPESSAYKSFMESINQGYRPELQQIINPMVLSSAWLGNNDTLNGVTPLNGQQVNGITSLANENSNWR